MKNTIPLKISWLVSSLLAFAVAMPAVASTEDEVKALKGEIEVLQKGQDSMREDLAAIRKLLEQGARAAPAAAPGFAPKDLVVGESAVVGEADAPVTMFSYSDFQCPYCRRHATTVLTDILKEYVDNGKLRIVMREFPIESIHPRAFAASQAAVCAGAQGKYREMHDLIFSDQKALTDADLSAHAQTLGVDQAEYEACLADKEISDGIRADIREAQGMGISGTPSFVVGLTNPEDLDKVRVTRYIRGAQPFPSFMGAIDDQLEEAAKVQ
jgi:protein-disulfide isomerase